jgi:hypothetical protein
MTQPETVGDDIPVYRMVKTSNCRPVGGQWEFKSSAFSGNTPKDADGNQDMSVVLGDTLAELDRRPEDLPSPDEGSPALSGPEWGVIVINSTALRNEDANQTTLRTPDLPHEPAHGDARGRKRNKERTAMKKAADWVVRPAQPVPDSAD